MFHIIMGLLKPSSGTIEIFGGQVNGERDFRSVRERIGLLFQDADDQLFSPTVLEDVAFGPLNLGKSQEDAKAIAQKTLDLLGLSRFEDRVTYKLSGGEKKLVSLATVLAMEPEILLLDEPSNGLDDNTKARLMKAISQLDLSFILISHEIDFLSETADFICEMRDGKILFDEEDMHIPITTDILMALCHTNISSNGRIKKWAKIPAEDKYLGVILLEDGETVHNAFLDRSFKED
jgi:cobalt/nickel transport system ATP-binding protein